MKTGDPSGEVSTPPEGEERVGPFPSWRWVYVTVVLYGVVLVVLLTLLSRALDFGSAS